MGVRERRAGLKRKLQTGEEPYEALFLRFFPLDFFASRFADVAARHRGKVKD